MSRMIRERDKLKQFKSILAEHGIKVDLENGIDLLDELADFFTPEIVRTADEKMTAAREKMLEAISILQNGQPLDVAETIKESGLDPKNRSDIARTRLFLKECGLLIHKPGEPEQWIKRITGPETKTSEAGLVNDTE